MAWVAEGDGDIMKRWCVASGLIACLATLSWLAGCSAVESKSADTTAFQPGNDLQTLFLTRDVRTKRSSSADDNWQNGNADSRRIRKGETLELANLKGPGIIRHIWFTPSGGGPRFPRALVLRMYWDGNPDPAVESPLGDFFAVGHGIVKLVTSLPVSITADGKAYNCYWPMPFARHAHITMTNDGPEDAGLYWYIDYEEVPSLTTNTAYFHAQYRQEYPCTMGRDYLILDAEGSGHYVGTVQSTQIRTQSWYGEGDDRFFIDGETEPSLRGTGTEDYFCDAWGFRVIDRPFYGVPLMEGFNPGDRVSVYRWHICDPVHFRKSLRVTIEDKGVTFTAKGEKVSGFMERQDLMSSVAFWYQTGKAKRFASLPPYDERVIREWRVEMEASVETARIEPAGATVTSQKLGICSNYTQLLAVCPTKDAVLTVPFKLKKEAKGIGRLQCVKSWDCGTWKASIDGKPLPDMENADLYCPELKIHVFNLGYMELAAGDHELRLECVGRNPASKGFSAGLDVFSIVELTPYYVPGKP
jgi:hypothetical protein